jgi:hypothetical protein
VTLLALEGFEGGSLDSLFFSGAGEIVSHLTRGSWSAGALNCGSSEGVTYVFPGGSSNEVYFSFGWRGNDNSGEWVLQPRSPNEVEQVNLHINTGGFLNVRRGTTVLATGTTPIQVNRWYHIQFYVLVHDTTGRVQVKLDGVDEIHSGGSYIGSLDTRSDAASDLIDRVGFSRDGTSQWDDFIAHSAAGSAPFNTWPGDRGIIRCRLNAEGDTKQWLAKGETASSYDTEVLTNGVAAYASYRLDETSGTVADNAEGTAARDGTYEGTPTLGTASNRERIRTGDKYMVFDGSNDWVALPSDILQLTSANSAWSCELWLRFAAGTGNVTMGIFGGRSSTDTDPINSLYMFQQGDGQGDSLRWDTRGDNGVGLNQMRALFGTNVTIDGYHTPRQCTHWHHIALTRSTAGVKRIYWDGWEVVSSTDGLTSGTGTLDRSDLGREEGQGVAFQGDISEFHVYRGELTAAEVATHYGRSAFRYEQADDYQLSNVWPPASTNGQDDWWHDLDASYIRSATTNDIELFGLEDVPSSYDAAYGVSLKAIVRKVDPGDRAIALVMKSSSTTDTSSDFGVGTSWSKIEKLYEVDPNGSAAWTNTRVNALQVGVKTR